MLASTSQLLDIAEQLFLVLGAHMDLEQREINAYDEFPCVKPELCEKARVILPACVDILMGEEIFGVLDSEIKIQKNSQHTRQSSTLGKLSVFKRLPPTSEQQKKERISAQELTHGISPIYCNPPGMILGLISEMNRNIHLLDSKKPLNWSPHDSVDKHGGEHKNRHKSSRLRARHALYNREAGEAALKGMKTGEYRRAQGQWPLYRYLQDGVCICPPNCLWCDQPPQVPEFGEVGGFPWSNGLERWDWGVLEEGFRGCSMNGGDWLCPCSTTMRGIVSYREQHCRVELHSECILRARTILELAIVAHEKARKPRNGYDNHDVERGATTAEITGTTNTTKRIIGHGLLEFYEQVMKYRKLDDDPGQILYDRSLDLFPVPRPRISTQSRSSSGSAHTKDDNDKNDYIFDSEGRSSSSSALAHSWKNSSQNSSQTDPSSLYSQGSSSNGSGVLPPPRSPRRVKYPSLPPTPASEKHETIASSQQAVARDNIY